MASSGTNINEALVDERIVESLRHLLPLLGAFSYSVDAQNRTINDTILVPLAVDPTEDAKTPGAIGTATGGLSTATVTLDQFRSSNWDAVEGNMRASLLEQYWADKAAGAVHVLAARAINYALGKVTALSYGDTSADKLTILPGDVRQSDIAALWELASAKIKRQAKTLIVNSSYAAAIFGNTRLTSLYAVAGKNIFEGGVLPTMLDLTTMHYGDLPDNGENLGGLVIGRAAIAIGIAEASTFLTSGLGDIIERRTITEPDSGISAVYTVSAGAGGKLHGEVHMLYGATAAQNSIVRLVKE